jgi:hypothetical protein
MEESSVGWGGFWWLGAGEASPLPLPGVWLGVGEASPLPLPGVWLGVGEASPLPLRWVGGLDW